MLNSWSAGLQPFVWAGRRRRYQARAREPVGVRWHNPAGSTYGRDASN